jgi:hypothetical protein
MRRRIPGAAKQHIATASVDVIIATRVDANPKILHRPVAAWINQPQEVAA